jgi:hypothetical protein
MSGILSAILLSLVAAAAEGGSPASASMQESAEQDYERGLALARLGDMNGARAALEAGRAKAPADPRFAVELAGVEYRLQNHKAAKRWLKAALTLDCTHAYANDFAGTLFLADRNTRAALKYWNRIDKPRIEDVRYEPPPRLDPILLDRAFAFAPGSLLRLDQYDTTLRRLELLDVFADIRLELVPRRDGAFDLSFRNAERAGTGGTWASRALGLAKGIPYQTVHVDLFNLRGSAVNSVSQLRWDARKRRYSTSLTGPVGDTAARGFRVDFDARDEEWDLGTPGAIAAPRFRMRRIEAGAFLHVAAGASWRLHTGFAFGDRRFNELPPLAVQHYGLRDGLSLEYRFGLRRDLSPSPEKRASIEYVLDFELGRMFRTSAGPFVRLESGFTWQWYPQPRGSDYHLQGRLVAGMIRGQSPFDKLFSLGLERDNDLFLRGHPGTREGRKGSGPLGRDFLVFNLEAGKKLFAGGFWNVTLGPFVDTGTIRDPDGPFGVQEWLIDCGVQSKITLMKQVVLTFSFGKDLRSGGHALYYAASH